uniref:COX assembly mitochondrial protein n=1 Tax=Accipiter nisus TaxID=211598 RepID=A0A8B9N671_9AVES
MEYNLNFFTSGHFSNFNLVCVFSSFFPAFTKCCQETGLLMVVKCRQENTALKDCLVGYYSDPLFYEECKTEYLKQREEYRATGIKKKRQKLSSNV